MIIYVKLRYVSFFIKLLLDWIGLDMQACYGVTNNSIVYRCYEPNNQTALADVQKV